MNRGAANVLSGRTVVDVPGWPAVFELNEGKTYRLQRTAGKKSIDRVIRVIGIKEFWEPDYWTDNSARRTLRRAEVIVDVSGVVATLVCRPYQLPSAVNGLRTSKFDASRLIREMSRE